MKLNIKFMFNKRELLFDKCLSEYPGEHCGTARGGQERCRHGHGERDRL